MWHSCPPVAVFVHNLLIVEEVNALVQTHVLEVWLGLASYLKYYPSNKSSFVAVEYHGDHKTTTKLW